MSLPRNKTKLVATIGPASASAEVMQRMIQAGMNIARLNFSHGEFAWHGEVIENLRKAASAAGRRLTIMADLPGPKMRIGQLAADRITLHRGDLFTLTSEQITGGQQRVHANVPRLAKLVKPGDHLFLNDGNVELEVVESAGEDVVCRVLAGGELRSRKGLNLPGVDLGISAFTPHDQECLRFALAHGVDAVSQSFVENAGDVQAVRQAALELGHHPFIIAKIERSGALDHLDEILDASDGIMVARGDLGVETRLENIAVLQKQLIQRANLFGKPVITATEMLESMTHRAQPTRAEATDVANAILDGTDCVMLSEESAMGEFPVEAVGMLAKIAAATEPHRSDALVREAFAHYDRDRDLQLVDHISRTVRQTVINLAPSAVIVPTASGYTARMVSRFKLPVWIAAVSLEEATCRGLQFSYGVSPIHARAYPGDWMTFSKNWVEREALPGSLAVLTHSPSGKNPEAHPRLEILDLRR